jgi:hypothetical protein
MFPDMIITRNSTLSCLGNLFSKSFIVALGKVGKMQLRHEPCKQRRKGRAEGERRGAKVLDEGNVRKLSVDYCKCIHADACIENIRDITNI